MQDSGRGLAIFPPLFLLLLILGCADDRTPPPETDAVSLAHVEAVALVKSGSAWSVSVTVAHDDCGWDHFADWWRITDESGRELARRVLRHPHIEEQPFTRSLEGVAFPPDVERFTVEAHCSAHGYGGSSVRVDLSQEQGPGFTVCRQPGGDL